MTVSIAYLLNKASALEITEHLTRCDADFVPPLSDRVVIKDYAQQVASKAVQFEAWSGGTLVGLVAAYCNDCEQRIAYITNVSVLRAWSSKGIAAHLVSWCIEYVATEGFQQIRLEVASDNVSAIRLYEKSGFVAGQVDAPLIVMRLQFE